VFQQVEEVVIRKQTAHITGLYGNPSYAAELGLRPGNGYTSRVAGICHFNHHCHHHHHHHHHRNRRHRHRHHRHRIWITQFWISRITVFDIKKYNYLFCIYKK